LFLRLFPFTKNESTGIDQERTLGLDARVRAREKPWESGKTLLTRDFSGRERPWLTKPSAPRSSVFLGRERVATQGGRSSDG